MIDVAEKLREKGNKIREREKKEVKVDYGELVLHTAFMSSFPLSPQYVRNNIKVESKVRMGYPSPRYSLLQHIPRRTSPPRGVEHNCFSSLIARPTTLPSLLMNVQLPVKMYRDKKGGKDGIYKVSLLRPPHVATWEFYKLKHPPPPPPKNF